MPNIQNVSLKAVLDGDHMPSDNAVLIQIVDPGTDFPEPSRPFIKRHFLSFYDVGADAHLCNQITTVQATNLVHMLREALAEGHDVVVHCVAGLCRSGAVTEVGAMMGFHVVCTARLPNVLVKHRMMQVLGWTYD